MVKYEDGSDDVPWRVAILIAMGILLLAWFFTMVGVFTHESHIRDLRYNNQQMKMCIAQTTRSVADCRSIVYGTP